MSDTPVTGVPAAGDLEPEPGLRGAEAPAALLSWGELLHSLMALFRLSGRVIFRRKLLFMGAGILVYYAILYAFAVYEPGSGFSVEEALFVLVEVPGTVLAIYLTMDLIAKERDRNTLEVLFSTASSHYTVWSVRMLAIYAVLLVTLMIMSTISYFFFAEFPFIWGGLNAFIPAFLFANLTFYFAVFTRSANTAGMLALGGLILVLMWTGGGMQGTNYDLFLKPFRLPMTAADPLWMEKMIINRVAVFASGAMLLFLALRRMEYREKLLS